MSAHVRAAAAFVTLALVGQACGGSAATSTDDQLRVVTASFDLAIGDDVRYLAGLFTTDGELVLGGEVDMRFYEGGYGPEVPDIEPDVTSTGVFLPVPGKEPRGDITEPTVGDSSGASGVYQTHVDFDRPGMWTVRVDVTLADGDRLQGAATFHVAEEPQVVAVGDPAPATDNLTLDSDVPAVAIDSRAQDDHAEIPDPELHRITVVEAIRLGRPAVVVISTPTYCVSQFCGPITETVEDMAAQYSDVAEFIHIEVWQHFDDEILNDAAAAWIQTEGGGNEPWVFLIGSDGTISARWDNVLDAEELRGLLDGLG
jgi:hypothetical protein